MAGSERDNRERSAAEEAGRAVGGLAGRAAETAANFGASMLMGAAETLGGWWSQSARAAAESWDEAMDRRSRQHFEGSMDASAESRSSAESGYEQARPYYQLGHTARQNPDYDARKFSEVEPELRRVAESREAEEKGGERNDWPDVRGYVQFGYEQGEGGATDRS